MTQFTSSEYAAIQTLLNIMEKLRDPNTGCPWDLKQTFDSLINCTIEEVYEVKEAIINNDMPELKEELGDLLFQIVFYAKLAKEKELFDFEGICHSISEKLIRRHPHVFEQNDSIYSQNNAQDPDLINEGTVKEQWEKIKQTERNGKNLTSVMDNIPQSLPALIRAEKIQKRAKSVGFDWDEIDSVFDKIQEEIEEIKETLVKKQSSESTQEEVGDLLFAVVNLTRHLGFNAESTLDKANEKFMSRFRRVENIFLSKEQSIQTANLQEMESAWQAVKKENN